MANVLMTLITCILIGSGPHNDHLVDGERTSHRRIPRIIQKILEINRNILREETGEEEEEEHIDTDIENKKLIIKDRLKNAFVWKI